MRITFISTRTGMSGGDRVMHIYAKALKQRGHSVCLVTRPMAIPLKKRVRSLLSGRGLPPRLTTGPTFFNASSYEYRIAAPIRPIDAPELPDADVVIATWWETAEWVQKYPSSKGKKVHFVQHYEAFPDMPKDRVDAVLRLPMYKITISRWLSDMLKKEFGASRVALVPNSVDFEQFNAGPRGKQKQPTLGMLYSVHPSKDCRTGFRAFAMVRKTHPDARLLMFGATPPLVSLPVPRGAILTQLPPQDRIRDIYASCDVWLCSSESEGFGLPVLEAMACRCPIVSTAVGGPIDLITEGVEGFLTPVGDAEAMADRANAILAMPDADWRKMSDAAYAKATSYSWNDAVDRFEAALNEAAQAPDQPASDAAEPERHGAKQSIDTSNALSRKPSISGKLVRKAHEAIIWTISNVPFGKEVTWRGYNYFLKRVWRHPFTGKTSFGAVMECDLRDTIQRTIFSFGVWEPRVTEIISHRLKEGSVFIDIGANVGYDTLLASYLVGNSGKVYSIEASPANFAILQRNLIRNRCTNVIAINKAVSREPGRLVLYAEGPNTGITTTDASRGFPAVAEVEALPLEMALDPQTLKETCLIKMDVEGGEIPILEHISETSDLYSRDIEIIVELSMASDADEWFKHNRTLQRFFGIGFKCYAIDDDYDLQAYFRPKAFKPKEINQYPEKQMEVLLTRSSL